MLKKYSLILFSFMYLIGIVEGESLWNPGFNGYLSPGNTIRVGDTIVVSIDSNTALSFQSATQDSRNLSLQFSGGKVGNIFAFLPKVQSGGDMSGRGKEGLTLKTTLVARVKGIDPNGMLAIGGSRTISVNGQEESILLSGIVDPRDLDRGKFINFSMIADSSLIFKTLLEPGKPVLTTKDIKEIITQSNKVQVGTAQPLQSNQGTQSSNVTAQTTTTKTFSLSDAKKKQLLLIYLNKMIDLLFK